MIWRNARRVLNFAAMARMLKVIFADGRIARLPEKLARSPYCANMGGRVEEPLPELPPVAEVERPKRLSRPRKRKEQAEPEEQTTIAHAD